MDKIYNNFEVDYRKLLYKYMTDIVRYEGTCFTHILDKNDFSKEELEALESMSRTINQIEGPV